MTGGIGVNAHGITPTPPFAASAVRRRTGHGLGFSSHHAVGTTRRLCRNIRVTNINTANLVACVHASSLHVSSRTQRTNGTCVNRRFNGRCLPAGTQICGAGNGTRSTRRTVHPSVPSVAPSQIGRSLANSRCQLCGLV